MKKIQGLVILSLLLFVLLTNLSAQTTEFAEAGGSGTGEAGYFAEWNFAVGANKYEVKQNGRAKKTNAKNTPANFRLPLAADEAVVNVYFATHKNSLIVLYGASAGGEGLGYIASFDSMTLKLKWKAIISGFNVGKGLIENQYAYLTAIGFVGKINLLTGKYVWKHDDLYGSKGAFNSFELPELEGGNVVFTEKAYDNSTNILVVNKVTGKIVRTILDKK